MLYTGCRPNEARGLLWKNVFNRGTTSVFEVLKTGGKGMDTAWKNSIKFFQYYCSNVDEKMGYFGVKNGNKK